jgi:hypothetical protein
MVLSGAIILGIDSGWLPGRLVGTTVAAALTVFGRG